MNWRPAPRMVRDIQAEAAYLSRRHASTCRRSYPCGRSRPASRLTDDQIRAEYVRRGL